MTRTRKPRVTLAVEPRFSGGTSSAVAHEIRAIAEHVDLRVCAIETKMFKGRKINPTLEKALADTGTPLIWDEKIIRGEIVVFHNNSCLKFNEDLGVKFYAQNLIVVTHENFLRPDGSFGFDVDKTINMIEASSMAMGRFFSPVSDYNRDGVEAWLAGSGRKWTMTPFNWFNICDFEMHEPNHAPKDRRGRLSRAGFEKFPAMSVMKSHFHASAESNVILGGDSFLLDPTSVPAHWKIYPFGSRNVNDFLHELDFFVYYTHPQWRESFGRVIAEAICAGKVVITDPGTAKIFGSAVIASHGDRAEIDGIISEMVIDPEKYVAFVKNAQSVIAGFSTPRFKETVLNGALSLKGEYNDFL